MLVSEARLDRRFELVSFHDRRRIVSGCPQLLEAVESRLEIAALRCDRRQRRSEHEHNRGGKRCHPAAPVVCHEMTPVVIVIAACGWQYLPSIHRAAPSPTTTNGAQ